MQLLHTLIVIVIIIDVEGWVSLQTHLTEIFYILAWTVLTICSFILLD